MAMRPDFHSLDGLREQLTQVPRHSNKPRVIREAPKVCPAPIRTKDKPTINGARKKSNTVRVKTLSRPTISSLAKTRAKLSTSSKENFLHSKTRRNTKSTNRISPQAAKHRVQSIDSMKGDFPSDEKPLVCRRIFEDLSSDVNSEGGYSDKIEVNPLLTDADDFMFEVFSEEAETPSSVSCCTNFDICDSPQSTASFSSLFSVPTTCALSFAAGFGVGMAFGSCNFLRHPLSA